MKIISLSGRKGAGKDEVCAAILAAYPGGLRLAFADPLKQEICDACGVSLQTINDNKSVFRPILQWWGTEFRRQFQKQPDYWIDQLRLQLYHCQMQKVPYVIVTDARFLNELRMVKRMGGVTVLVNRPHTGETDIDPHSSEQEWRQWDFDDNVIPNTGSLTQLKANAIEWFTKLP